MSRAWPILLILAALCFGQKQTADHEEEDLQTALAEAGSSAVEFTRALENHLAKYPNSAHKADIERALVKAAVENKDERRLILYGERVLARDPDDPSILERVARALNSTGDKEQAGRALKYARHYEQLLLSMDTDKASGGREAAQLREELDQRLARALVLEAQATGNLGKTEEAIALARKSFDSYPTEEAAREAAKWLASSGKDLEAVRFYCDAFVLPDSRSSEAMRAKDRVEMGELYRKVKGSEAGLGDLVLEAYDRTSATLAQRRFQLRQLDPNLQATKPMDFTLSGVKGEKLSLASLKGKVLVLDFWATWCGPCRAQHPLYEKVKKVFAENSDVVFLSVNTDEERALVAPFLQANKWDKAVYFEEGMSAALHVSSIPTTIIIDPRGEVFSRMNGYIPDRFVDMLTERIREALKGVAKAASAQAR
jgi:thiol-disulfide isomerase/thioredoxin